MKLSKLKSMNLIKFVLKLGLAFIGFVAILYILLVFSMTLPLGE